MDTVLGRTLDSETLSMILLDLFILIVFAKSAGLLCELTSRVLKGKLVIPAVIGEIIAGIIIGNTFIEGWLHLSDSEEVFEVLKELGVIFLLFVVGLETPFSELRKVGVTAFFVALFGVIVPFFAGYIFFLSLGFGNIESLFVGAAMVATSVGITARVIKDMNLTNAKESRVIIGAAVIDDVMGMIVLGIVVGIAGGSGSDLTNTAIVAVEAVLFVLGIMFIGNYLGKYVAKKKLENKACPPTTANSHSLNISALSIALVLCFGISYLASILSLAAIVGAFLAGMLFAEFKEKYFCQDQMEAINEFLVPFFFLFIGIGVDISVFGPVLGIAITLTLIAIATKFIGCGLGAIRMGRKSAMIVGSGMFPRGEVALIVASIGFYTYGVINQDVFNIVVFMSIVTTLVSPPVLTYFYRKKYGKEQKVDKKLVEEV